MRFKNGYVKFYRRAAAEDIGNNVYCLALWTWLLCAATRFESKIIWRGKQRVIPSGTILLSMKTLAEKWDCSKTTLRRWLLYLNDTGRISFESGPRGSLVTICNWKEYQENQSGTVSPGDREVTPLRHRCDTAVTHIREVKNIRTKEKYSKAFDDIYKTYPLKIGKTRGYKIFQKIPAEGYLDLTKAIKNYSKYLEIAKKQKYTKHFSTFMGEWDDWIDPDPSMLRAAGGAADIDWDYIFDRKEKT